MAQPTIAIIGTGLIGTSIGLGLLGRTDRKYQVVGADRERNRARIAKKMGAIDQDVGSLEEAVSSAGLIILAVPVQATRHLLREMVPYLGEGSIVTDTSSTKADVMRWADEHLPRTVDFVGSHPMAGKERSGPEAATADLFKDAMWAITPSRYARAAAVSTIVGLVESLGANALHIDAAEHDQYAAAVSHMPLMLSVALFRLIRDSHGWEDAALMAGPGFKDLTRLASGDPTMGTDIVATNKEAIVHWLRRYREELETIEKAIDMGHETIHDLFASTQLDRDSWMLNPQTRRMPEGPALPSAQDAIGQFLGGAMYNRFKDMSSQQPPSMDSEELRRKLNEADKRRDS